MRAFGHPTPDVLDRLDDDLVLRTDLHGDITIEPDGDQIWVRTQLGGSGNGDPACPTADNA